MIPDRDIHDLVFDSYVLDAVCHSPDSSEFYAMVEATIIYEHSWTRYDGSLDESGGAS